MAAQHITGLPIGEIVRLVIAALWSQMTGPGLRMHQRIETPTVKPPAIAMARFVQHRVSFQHERRLESVRKHRRDKGRHQGAVAQYRVHGARHDVVLGIDLIVMSRFVEQQGIEPGGGGEIIHRGGAAHIVDLAIERNLGREPIGDLVVVGNQPHIQWRIHPITKTGFILGLQLLLYTRSVLGKCPVFLGENQFGITHRRLEVRLIMGHHRGVSLYQWFRHGPC